MSLNQLINKPATLKFLESYNEKPDINQLKTRTEKIKTQFANFETIQEEIENLDDSDKLEEIEKKYFEFTSRAETLILENKSTSKITCNTETHMFMVSDKKKQVQIFL